MQPLLLISCACCLGTWAHCTNSPRNKVQGAPKGQVPAAENMSVECMVLPLFHHSSEISCTLGGTQTEMMIYLASALEHTVLWTSWVCFFSGFPVLGMVPTWLARSPHCSWWPRAQRHMEEDCPTHKKGLPGEWLVKSCHIAVHFPHLSLSLTNWKVPHETFLAQSSSWGC